MKRKNMTRWNRARLRRLQNKLAKGVAWGPNGYEKIPAGELYRCKMRAGKLWNMIYAWKAARQEERS